MNNFQITVISKALESATTVKQRKELILKVTDEIEDNLTYIAGHPTISVSCYQNIILNVEFIHNLPSKYLVHLPKRIPAIINIIRKHCHEYVKASHNT